MDDIFFFEGKCLLNQTNNGKMFDRGVGAFIILWLQLRWREFFLGILMTRNRRLVTPKHSARVACYIRGLAACLPWVLSAQS